MNFINFLRYVCCDIVVKSASRTYCVSINADFGLKPKKILCQASRFIRKISMLRHRHRHHLQYRNVNSFTPRIFSHSPSCVSMLSNHAHISMGNYLFVSNLENGCDCDCGRVSWLAGYNRIKEDRCKTWSWLRVNARVRKSCYVESK